MEDLYIGEIVGGINGKSLRNAIHGAFFTLPFSTEYKKG